MAVTAALAVWVVVVVTVAPGLPVTWGRTWGILVRPVVMVVTGLLAGLVVLVVLPGPRWGSVVMV
ncbi:hypothetical protein NGTWS1702_38340 [Mycolicibacterium cyprinidarum]|uniref:Uncharacterized protein n=1 Tax=Mycolicibacterium cyprinidarum TaxID=2860311 RepID=A0ABQ4V7E7_9MYCO|nr:hypothetical protein NGTWS1702_38340 [Mycolicibacterium sp. NGTWSNA01]